jgi:hypothetical protein
MSSISHARHQFPPDVIEFIAQCSRSPGPSSVPSSHVSACLEGKAAPRVATPIEDHVDTRGTRCQNLLPRPALRLALGQGSSSKIAANCGVLTLRNYSAAAFSRARNRGVAKSMNARSLSGRRACLL